MLPQQSALIIIDMQEGMAGAGLPPRNNPDAENKLANLLAAWREAGKPVIHVRHISRSHDSVFFPGRSGVNFQQRFQPLPMEHVVEKNVADAFINTGLERWLHARDIRHIIIAGVSTNISVESSARTAGNLGFSTVVVDDATFAFQKRDHSGALRGAEEVHSMALANLDGEFAAVRSTDEVLAGYSHDSAHEDKN